MLSPDLASILCYLCSLRRYWSVLCWNPCQLFQVSETRDVFGRNMIRRLLLVNDGTFHRIIYRIIPCFLSHIASHISQFSVAFFPRPCYMAGIIKVCRCPSARQIPRNETEDNFRQTPCSLLTLCYCKGNNFLMAFLHSGQWQLNLF